MSVVVDRQDGLGFHGVPGKEAVVQAVFFCADDLDGVTRTFLSVQRVYFFDLVLLLDLQKQIFFGPLGGSGNKL